MVLQEQDVRPPALRAPRERQISTTLAGIRRVYPEDRLPSGAFRKLHVREGLAEPIALGDVPFEELAAVIPEGALRCDGLSFAGVSGLVEDAFAWPVSDSLALYGRRRAGMVAELGLYFLAPAGPVDAFARALAPFADAHRLHLIDWCRAHRVGSDEQSFRAYLSSANPRVPGRLWAPLP